MSGQSDQNPLKAAVQLAQSLGPVAGVDLSALNILYGRRSPDHIAEVARLGREHTALIAGMDRYADSRVAGYDGKTTELTLDGLDEAPMEAYFSQARTKSE